MSRSLLRTTLLTISALLVVWSQLATASVVWAQQSDCSGNPAPIAIRPVAPAGNAADLPAPFGYRPGNFDRAAVLRDVSDVVKQQAAGLGVDACYQQKIPGISQRIDFLSPAEFLIVSLYGQDLPRRDALLDRYASDPKGAIGELAQVAPTPRAQMILATYAYYDLDADRIFVNVAQVPQAELRRVLVHESWHAMPRLSTWTDQSGTPLRASGFWSQEHRAGPRAWLPVEDRGDLPYEPYLLNEGMATLMETRYAGPSRFAQKDVVQVQQFLAHLMEVAGPRDVMRSYLESKPDGLVAVVNAHRESLPELQPLAHP
jgi:hypothetical protein